MGMTIGIDLGTTNSAACIKKVKTSNIRNAEGEDLTPSCVTAIPNADNVNYNIVVGQHSRDLLKQYPEQTILSIKRLIGRDFEDPEVCAVCGPVIPGSFASPFERASGLVYSSVLVRGPDWYLNSYRPVKNVRKGLTDTCFLRTALLQKGKFKPDSFSKSGRHFCINAETDFSFRYDPDVAVLKKVPSLFVPYLRFAAGEAFSDGYNAIGRQRAVGLVWPLILLAVWLVLSTGWMFIPGNAYAIMWLVYASTVILTALSCFDPVSAPLFALGLVCDHIVRAVAFPAGLIKRLLKERGN